MKVDFRDGLLYTSVLLIFKGKDKVIDNVIIDTGAANTIINPDSVSELGVAAEKDDQFVISYGIGGEQYSYRKVVEKIVFDSFEIPLFKVDFGMISDKGEINGLIGLNLLMKSNAITNLETLEVHCK